MFWPEQFSFYALVTYKNLPFYSFQFKNLVGVEASNFVDPLSHVGHSSVDTGKLVFAAPDSPRNHTDLFPMIAIRSNKRSAAVTLQKKIDLV